MIGAGLVAAAVFPMLYGLGLVYQHAQSPAAFAEVRCSERFPSLGPDDAGRLACLEVERDRSPGEILQPYTLPALAMVVTGSMLWIFGRNPQAPRASTIITLEDLELGEG